ncbi:MAG: MATE family efflux transporter [Myxococcota bacterium]|nr:MATE family efflux transporter [Myxococcota bacterium]
MTSTFGLDPARAKKILILAAPIVIAMLTQTSINIVDTIFVGKLDPSRSIPGQAALGFSLPLLWAFGGSLAAIGVGTQVMTARRWGAGKPEEAGKTMLNSAIIATLSAIVMSVIAWFAIPDAFGFLTTNHAVTDVGIPYARLRILGITSLVLTTAYKGFFDGLSKTRVHMYAALVMNAANIVLNYIFIFGMGSIPAMYVRGAGVASLISTFIGLFIVIGWTLAPSYREFKIYRPSNIDLKTMWELTKLSVPSGMAQIFIMSGVLMFLKIIAALDDQAVSNILHSLGHYASDSLAPALALQQGLGQTPAIGNSALVYDWGATMLSSRPPLFTTAAKLIIDLLSIGFVTTIAFGTATATLVSQSMGKRNFQLASDYGWDSVKMGMYFYGALGLIVVAFPMQFLDFLSDDHQVMAAAVPGLRIMASLQMFIAMALVLTQALFGAGATRFVMIVEFILHGICLAPLAFLFAMVLDFGFLGVWLSGTLYVFLLAMVMGIKFWRGSWTSIEV